MTFNRSLERTARAVFASAALCGLLACSGGNSATLPQAQQDNGAFARGTSIAAMLPPPAIAPLEPPSGTGYLGAYVSPGDPETTAALESRIGRRLALNIHYYGFNAPFPGSLEADDARRGRIPILSWDCVDSNARVASGADDEVIRDRADALSAYGHPVFLRYMWEMNLGSNPHFRAVCYDPKTDLPGGFFSEREYIRAWKHIRGVFAARNVHNVVWLWNPSAGGRAPSGYYPGADGVDWIGMDNYAPGNGSLEATFTKLYGELAGYAKPIMIGETGTDAANQLPFIANAAAELKAAFPRVRAVSFYDGSGNRGDWTLTNAAVGELAEFGANQHWSAHER